MNVNSININIVVDSTTMNNAEEFEKQETLHAEGNGKMMTNHL
jgi:hypothetical protein